MTAGDEEGKRPSRPGEGRKVFTEELGVDMVWQEERGVSPEGGGLTAEPCGPAQNGREIRLKS